MPSRVRRGGVGHLRDRHLGARWGSWGAMDPQANALERRPSWAEGWSPSPEPSCGQDHYRARGQLHERRLRDHRTLAAWRPRAHLQRRKAASFGGASPDQRWLAVWRHGGLAARRRDGPRVQGAPRPPHRRRSSLPKRACALGWARRAFIRIVRPALQGLPGPPPHQRNRQRSRDHRLDPSPGHAVRS